MIKDYFLVKKLYLPLVLILIFELFIMLLYSYYSFNNTKKELFSQTKNSLTTLYNFKLKEKKDIGFNNVLIISNDSIIKKSIKTHNRLLALNEIKSISKVFKKYTNMAIKIHIHTNNIHSFIRSWNIQKYGDDLTSFRKTLIWVKKHKKPLIAIEIGRAGLLLRAIAPIMENQNYLGSVEFIQDLDSIQKDLKKENIYFLVMVKNKYLNISTFKNKPLLNNNYVMALNNYDKLFYKELKNTQINSEIETNNFYAISIPIKNFESEIVAYAIIGKSKKALNKIFLQKKIDILVNLFVMNLIGLIFILFIVYTIKQLKHTFEKSITDHLTGLYNRNYLMQRLHEIIARVKREESELIVIFVDLNNFKQINDNIGHDKGDEVLIKVAKLMKTHFREYDLLARFGGDEFIIAIETLKHLNISDIKNKMDELNEIVKNKLSKYNISFAYGISTTDETTNLEELIKLADERMYRYKKEMKKR